MQNVDIGIAQCDHKTQSHAAHSPIYICMYGQVVGCMRWERWVTVGDGGRRSASEGVERASERGFGIL